MTRPAQHTVEQDLERMRLTAATLQEAATALVDYRHALEAAHQTIAGLRRDLAAAERRLEAVRPCD